MLMDIVYLYFKTKKTKSKRYHRPAAGSLGGSARYARQLLSCLLCLAGSLGDETRLRSDE